MKVIPHQIVFEAVEWHPEMNPATGMPVWGPAAHGIHQASHNMGAIGLVTLRGQAIHVHEGDFLVLEPDGGIYEVLKPGAFHVKYRQELVVEETQKVEAQGVAAEADQHEEAAASAYDPVAHAKSW